MKMLVLSTDVNEKFNLENAKLFEHSSIEINMVDNVLDVNSDPSDLLVDCECTTVGNVDSILTPDGIIKTNYRVDHSISIAEFLNTVSDVKWDKDKIPLADDATPIGYKNGFIFFKQKNEAYTEDNSEMFEHVLIAVHESLLDDYAYEPCIFIEE